MSDATPLSQRIFQLANETPVFDGKARVLNQTAATIEDLLDEIDRTVLASALTFDTGTARLTLHVAGRRLHSICDADGSVADPDRIFGQALAVENQTLRDQAAALLKEFVKGSTLLAVISESSSLIDGDAPDSISVSSLQSLLGLDTLEDSHLPSIDRILARVDDKLTAWVRMSGSRLESTSGTVAEISGLKIALTTQLSSFEQRREQMCPSHSDPSMTCFLDTSKPGQTLGVATFADGKLLFSLQTSDFPLVYRAFRQIS